MRIPERATQIWPVLAFAAMNRQILTYEIVEQLIGSRPVKGYGILWSPFSRIVFSTDYRL